MAPDCVLELCEECAAFRAGGMGIPQQISHWEGRSLHVDCLVQPTKAAAIPIRQLSLAPR